MIKKCFLNILFMCLYLAGTVNAATYEIATAAQWNALAEYIATNADDLSGSIVTLTADIDFTSMSITPLSIFAGELEGNNHTLSGISYSASSTYQGALITTADTTAYIHDFSIAGYFATANASAQYCGAAVGALYGTAENVTSIVTCSGTAYYFSGVVGYVGTTATIEGCVYGGDFTVNSMYTGGVVGYADSGGIVKGCSCVGTMTYTGNYEGCVVGYSKGATVSECVNAATISTSAMQTYTGGIVGYCKGGTVDSCINNATLSNTCGYLGGIVAYADNCDVINCINNGTISYSSTISVYGYSGGIVAYASTANISNCVNNGSVTGYGNNTGGIVGYAFPATISYCGNEADITGGTYTGGIIGSANGTMTISECYNAGNINASGNYSAGISAYSTGATVQCCFNVGDITSAGNYVGGIAGQTYKVSDCYNAGTISGVNWVGGLAGQALSKMDNGYSIGTVSGTGDNISNMNGRTTVNSNLYYLSTNDANGQDDTSTGLTYIQLALLDLGDNWTAGDNYTYPRLTSLADNNYAEAYAAIVVPKDGDTYDSITGGFYVGSPDGVTWTAEPGVVRVDDNTASFTANYSGELLMTVTSGDVSVTTILNVVAATATDLNGSKSIEKFEEITAFTGDATDVVGVFTNWDFTGANVIETDGTNGLDTQVAAIYGGGALTSMTYAIRSDTIHGISFKAWNANDTEATLHVSYSSDWGTTWTETYALEETAASTVASGASEDAYVYSMELLDTAILLKISVDTEIGEGYITIDDLAVYTDDMRLTLSGEGTSDSPYIINNVEEWNSLATYISHMSDDLSGEYVLIASDIDFTDATIQSLSSFGGDLDGGGKSISNIALETSVSPAGGLINTATATANIHDLSVSGTLTSSGHYSGGVVGALYGSLSNVSSNVDVSSSLSHVGGVVGVSYESATISGCSNSGDVTSSDLYVGGIVGASYPTASLTLVENSVNTGSVTYTGTSVTSGVAGIIGYLSTEEAVSVELSGNVNSGVVSCSDASGGASAGIISVYNNAAEETSSYSLVITSCGNEGEITSSYYTSGIVAYTSATSYLSMSLTDCWNSGTVSGVTETGGILSWAPQNTTISGCYNSGVVTSSGYDLGGIVGYVDGEDVVLSDCWNVGEVSGTDDGEGAGGIVGFIATRGCTINGAFNAGTVSAGYNYVGGIVGRSYSTTIENAYNVGSVSGADYVAGVVGISDDSNSDATSLVSVYNTGVVTASGTHYGNVASYSNSKYCVTESTYYLAANAYDTEEAGEALTYAELATLDLGDVWTSGDDYTYPRLTVIADNDYAKAYAAAVVPSGEDTYTSITDVFYLGQPDGVVWSVDNDVVTIEDGCGSIDEDYDGEVTLTATSGDVSVQTVLHCSIVTGIGSVDANSKEIVDERYYTLSGMEVTRPSDVDKSVYIIVRTYDDGTTSVVKQVR